MTSLQSATQQAADSVGGLDRHDVVARLQRTFASPSYRPPMLPEVALQVMQLSQRPEVRFEEVVALLQKDAVLAARVLSLAQSSAYAARSPIQSLQQASIRLGLKTMREVVLEAAIHLTVFRAPGYDGAMERLARHSAAVAHVTRSVCRRTNVESEFAFLCGLLHDVGFAASLLVLCGDPTWRKASFEDLAPLLDEVHQEASGVLARLWKLPANIQHVVSTHHEPAPGGKVELVNASLIVAEQLVWEAGAGLEPPPQGAAAYATEMPEPPHDGTDVNWTGLVEEACRHLRLDALAIGAARVEAFQLVQGLAGQGPAGQGEAAASTRRGVRP
jgi:HD-like signal output (HDOD) protein